MEARWSVRNRCRARSVAILTFLLAGGGVAAQRTWIVDRANGPGTDFTDLPPAVQAAAPGDVIRVRPAPGLLYVAPVIDKALTIVGDRLHRPVLGGVLEVRNVPAGRAAVIAHLKLGTVETRVLGSQTQRGFVATGNAGAVHVDSLEYGIDPRIQMAAATDPPAS